MAMWTRKELRLYFAGILLLVCMPLLLCHPAGAARPAVTLATDPWAPFYGPDLAGGGYLTQIAKAAFQRAGYACTVKFVPWKRALEGARIGQYDGLLGAFHTIEREAFFNYSDPIGESRLVFFAKRGRGLQYYDLTSMEGLTIGVIRGYQYSPEFDAAGYLRKEAVASVEQNIEKIIKGRIDLFIESEKVVQWLLRTKYPQYTALIQPLKPAYKINRLFIPISRKAADHQRLVDSFNSGLKAIRADGTFQKILRSHGF